ncbi:efflux RND transporter periplasmic adaptor subunit [Algoriphagus mannitolivorans]|uniref:efflux RND transporter periplasmic adaptor subunit n=1 Tax=Algoriphagus mannitolivorans TaxID=226504 RepID=UPI0003FB2D0B|nr:efflux RND transporter periplasmic adaptor subunit [Algoriphagus mannitolivorans]
MKPIVFFSVLMFSALFFSCGSGDSSGENSIEVGQADQGGDEVRLTKAQFEAMKMDWGKTEKATFSKEVNVQAMVKVPVEGMVEISAYFGGYVSGLKLVEGQPVRKGEILFYLENPDFIQIQQDYLQANSQLNYLKSEFERQKTLYGEQIASQKNYLKAEADYQSTLAKANSLKKQLALIHIQAEQLTPENIRSKIPVFSPVNGFVENVFVVPGTFLPVAGKAVTLISREHLHVELMVFEKDVTKVKVGQKVKLNSLDISENVFEAQVYMIGQVINESRQVMVHSHLLDEKLEEKLVPGMYLEGRLQLEPTERWAVPTRAIVDLDGESFILLKASEDEKGFMLKKVKVEVLESNGENTAIQLPQGMEEELVILAKGAFYLL